MTFAGQHSEAMLLGVLNVSILCDLVHLLLGVAGFLVARTSSGARAYLLSVAARFTWCCGCTAS